MASDLDSPSARPAQLPPGFDGLQYIASYDDLVQAFGADEAAGAQHYLAFGEAEGRDPDDFDEDGYLARYPDLQAAFGDDGQAATLHYIQFGFDEGRTDPPAGLPTGFNGLQYIASYDDLVQAFGADEAAGEQHYLNFGQAEGREADTFDVVQYLDNYPDLRAAFGNDGDAATIHYIQFGFDEGRTDADLTPGPGPGGNEPPAFTSPAAASVEENSTDVVLLAATDPDGGDVTFELTGGEDAALFDIEDDGQLVFLEAPDFEDPADADGDNVYDVEVTATDDEDETTPQAIAVTVTDVEVEQVSPMAEAAAADFLF
jgi:hypothetical protein